MSGFILLKIYTCILFKHSEAQIFVYYLFFNMGQVKLSMDKYRMALLLVTGQVYIFAISTPLDT